MTIEQLNFEISRTERERNVAHGVLNFVSDPKSNSPCLTPYYFIRDVADGE